MLDERLSRERINLLSRGVNFLRTFTTVEVLSAKTTEDQLIEKMSTKNFDLVLLPWHKYLEWSRVEGFWGLTRTSGPTTAGYVCEPLSPHQLGESKGHLRAILLDFVNLAPSELILLVKALRHDTLRSGIMPLLDPDAKIYTENWYGARGLGSRIDSAIALPEFQNPIWSKRGNSLRVCLSALWSLVYEEGPGKGEMNSVSTSSPKAYFQVATDKEIAVFRLCYQIPNWTPKNSLEAFWPKLQAPSSPEQLLLNHSDFLRIHTFSKTTEIEITVGFLASAPSDKSIAQIKTLWVEPLEDHLLGEKPYTAPGPAHPRLRPMPSAISESEIKLRALPQPTAGVELAQFMSATPESKVIELQTKLREKEELIEELKSGGIGTAPPLAPPDTEDLIEAFQQRYFDARFQIRQLELEIVALETRSATEEEIKNLKLKMEALANRERSWIKTLAETITAYKQVQRK